MQIEIGCQYCNTTFKYEKRGRFPRPTCGDASCVQEYAIDRRFNARAKRAYPDEAPDRRYEWIRRHTVFQRDDYVCYLCALPTDPDLQAPAALAPVVDHAIPLGAGGDHTMDNCKTAHSRCNTSKVILDARERWWSYLYGDAQPRRPLVAVGAGIAGHHHKWGRVCGTVTKVYKNGNILATITANDGAVDNVAFGWYDQFTSIT